MLTEHGFTYDKNGHSKYLGQFFFLYQKNEGWQRLMKILRPHEIQQIKTTFKVFEPRFERIWKIYSQKTQRIKILKEVLNQKRSKFLFDRLETVFGKKKRVKNINIIVLFSPLGAEATAAGGANIGDSHITLELPDLKRNTWQLDHSVGVLAHEVGHILFKINGWREKLKKLTNKTRLVEESVLSSFVPQGCLGQEYSNYKLSPMLLSNLDKKPNILWQIYPMALTYFKKRKMIDSHYISEVIKIVRSNRWNLKTQPLSLKKSPRPKIQ